MSYGFENLPGWMFYGACMMIAAVFGMGLTGILRWPATAFMLALVAFGLGALLSLYLP